MSMGSKIKKDVDLAEFTTFKIGGPARFLVEVEIPEELRQAEEWAKEKGLNIFLLGGGSNILVSDEGFNGLVVKLANKDLKIEEEKASCGAGVNLVWLLQEIANLGLSGLEWTVGIPGITLGGAIRGNAGAFGFYTSQIVESVEVYNTYKEEWSRFQAEDCQFDYRESIFKNRPELIIWGAELRFQKRDKSGIREDIKNNAQKRVNGQPRSPSAGSVFKNFTLEYLQKWAPGLADRARYEGIIKNGKVGVGWILEQLDLKDKKIGGAKVSETHANFIINTGEATALDVITLVSYIKQKVRQEFNLRLWEEIQYLGF